MSTAEGNLDDDDDFEEEERPRSRGPSQRPKKRRPVIEDDEAPVVAGRYLAGGLIMLAAVVIPSSKMGEWMEPPEPEATKVETWGVGVESIARITLVTADYNLLGCASEQSFDGVHCQNKAVNEIWPRGPNEVPDDFNNKLNIVQPYRTWYDNKLVFVAGLWATPDVSYRMHQEPALGVLPEKLARFAVECKLKFVGRFDSVKLRWSPQQNWVDPDGPAWVARAQSCKLIEEPQ